MIPNTPLIMWEKWVDPFGQDIEEAKWTDYDNNITDLYNPDESDTKDNKIIHHSKPIKVIASPMGLIPYNEYTASSKIFNFWLGHTNFNISSKVKNAIEQCPGIEILDVFTRYRFRIAIGKCFNDSDTMKIISDHICTLLGQHNDQQPE